MKQIKYWSMILLFTLSFASCEEKEEKLPTHKNPNWKVENVSQFPLSMTAIVRLPDQLKKQETNNDLVAAFVGKECRAVSKVNKEGVYLLMIKGTSEENRKVTFKYYSAKHSHIYVYEGDISFKVDDVYGSIDEPLILNLKPSKE